MFTTIAVVVGAVLAWVAADHLLLWLRERRGNGAATGWHGKGPGAVFHSTGFEDTLPPHEVTERLAPIAEPRRR